MISQIEDNGSIPTFLKRAPIARAAAPDDNGASHTGREQCSLSPASAPTVPGWRQRWPLTEHDKEVIKELMDHDFMSTRDKSYNRVGKLLAGKACKPRWMRAKPGMPGKRNGYEGISGWPHAWHPQLQLSGVRLRHRETTRPWLCCILASRA